MLKEYVPESDNAGFIYTWALTFSAFCVECQIYNNSMRHFFKTVISRILQIFNGLLQTKKVYTTRIITRQKEQ